MARLSPLDVCFFAVWGLVLSLSSAERQYFLQNTTNSSWVDARRHCQVCFKELVTLTPENIQNIAKGLSSEHWIGLRKRPVNSSDNYSKNSSDYLYGFNNTATFWSRWANGDPLSFQNWYPGHPMSKPSKDCCSCSCTCPARPTITTTITTPFGPPNATTSFANVSIPGSPAQPTTTTPFGPPNATTSFANVSTPGSPAKPTTTTPFGPPSATTSFANVSIPSTPFSTTAAPITGAPFESECVRKPVLLQDDEEYIEDPCVAMLSFGAWVEKECSALLPYICYEDRFFGEVSVTDINASSARISWEEGPGAIELYRLEVNGSVFNHTDPVLTCRLSRLTPGSLYSVQVFPVKCGRDLSPETGSFYTVPNKVTGLQVTDRDEKCVSLNWTRPEGNVDLYIVQTENLTEPIETNTETATVCGLTSGSLHSFKVWSGVTDQSQRSEESTVEAYTKPAKVSNLMTTDIKDTSLRLSWDKPSGSATGYRVTTSWVGKHPTSYTNETVETGKENELALIDLPSGTKITLSVTAFGNNKLEGDNVTVVCFTKPEDITKLHLVPKEDTITAEWNFSKGSPLFTVELWHENDLERTVADISETTVKFSDLKSATNYTVTVYSVTKEANSSGFSRSIFTLPNPPREAKLSGKSKQQLNFTWTPPKNTKTVQYLVTLNSSFWGQQWEMILDNKTTHTFDNLKSGTNYSFYVQTIAGSLSEAEVTTAFTEPALKEITLSMVCSSHEPLLCDSEAIRNSASQKLHSQFQSLLGNHVFWELEKIYTAKTGK